MNCFQCAFCHSKDIYMTFEYKEKNKKENILGCRNCLRFEFLE
mgnify:CR=1 FL=1